MSKPYIHALSSAKQFGGTANDYIEIHTLIDSSKSAIPSNLHRCLTHNSWFLFILERIKFSNSNEAPDRTFPTITNSDDKIVSVRSIGEQHILEDFKNKFLPTAQDYLQYIEFQPWMQNGNGYPPSYAGIKKSRDKNKSKPAPKTLVCDGKQLDFAKLFGAKEVTYDGSKVDKTPINPIEPTTPCIFPSELKD